MSEYDPLAGWKRLGCAVLLQAFKDAQGSLSRVSAQNAGYRDGMVLAVEAYSFLEGSGARWLVSALGLSPDSFERALEELPRPAQLSFFF
jgi:hypothetical protein